MKYYWFCFSQQTKLSTTTRSDVAHYHPFKVMDQWNRDDAHSEYTLLNWKEISEEDYSLAKQIEAKYDEEAAEQG